MRKFFVVVLFLIVGILGACSSEKQFNFDEGILVVGMECNYAPFNWTETTRSETNHPIHGTNSYAEGYDVQIAKRLAEELGLTLIIKKIDWDGLVISLKTGIIDVIIAGMSPTAERKESISFTSDYYTVEHVVLVKSSGRFADALDIADFSGAWIIGQKDTVYDSLAFQLASRAQGMYQNPLEDVPTIVYGIKTETSDATIIELPVAISIVANNPELKYIQLITPFELNEEDKVLSIGVRRGDNVLRERINDFLNILSLEDRKSLMDTAIEQSLDLI